VSHVLVMKFSDNTQFFETIFADGMSKPVMNPVSLRINFSARACDAVCLMERHGMGTVPISRAPDAQSLLLPFFAVRLVLWRESVCNFMENGISDVFDSRVRIVYVIPRDRDFSSIVITYTSSRFRRIDRERPIA
jgi:hypothetical protein